MAGSIMQVSMLKAKQHLSSPAQKKPKADLRADLYMRGLEGLQTIGLHVPDLVGACSRSITVLLHLGVLNLSAPPTATATKSLTS